MPFVHIRSLPLDGVEPRDVVESVRRELAGATGVAIEHVTVTWTALAATAGDQPLVVDLLVPDANPPERVEAMLRAAARSLSAAAGVPAERIFINAALARSGDVFDGGDIARW